MTSHHPVEHRFPDPQALVQALAGELRAELSEAIAMRQSASLVVSGGKTPTLLFQQLARELLDWSRVHVTLADERWIDARSEGSNERMVRSELLQQHAAAAQLVGLKNAAATAAEGVDWCWKSLTRIRRPLDVVILGMGDDGHTASLFPGSPGLDAALDSSRPPACVAMQAPVAPHERISLNLSALLDSRRIILHIQGQGKWTLYQRALQRGALNELPIRAVLHQTLTPVEVFWCP